MANVKFCIFLVVCYMNRYFDITNKQMQNEVLVLKCIFIITEKLRHHTRVL